MATDLDGTLLNLERRIGPADRTALEHLRRKGVTRVVATGRSLFSARRVLVAEDPIDYLVFSSGAGILDWSTGDLIRSRSLSGVEVGRAARVLAEAGLNFMIHDPVPDNHRFVYLEQKAEDTDFRRRCDYYPEFRQRLRTLPETFGASCQLLAVIPPDPGRYRTIRAALPDLTVIRTTSPLDGTSIWIEVFPGDVSKSSSSAWLASRLGVPHSRTYALGNDYNDADLLEWAGRSAVVANAPASLRSRFPVVASHTEGGFSAAVSAWGLV